MNNEQNTTTDTGMVNANPVIVGLDIGTTKIEMYSIEYAVRTLSKIDLKINSFFSTKMNKHSKTAHASIVIIFATVTAINAISWSAACNRGQFR